MTLRAVVTFGFIVALIVAGATTGAAARHRHHHHRPSEQVDTGQKAAPGERISPNPRAARMRQAEDALQKAVTSDPVASAAQIPGALRDPKIRAQVTAALAVATLPRPDLAGWRHRDGGYGWVGPVFWPFATFDLLDAALWGDAVDPTLWGYGAGDLSTGLFGIYPDDDVTAYAAYLPSATTAAPQVSMLARMCGEVKSGDIAGVPVESIKASLSLDDGQRTALDDLTDAVVEATQQIAAACPETLPLTAQQRVTAMELRLDAMIAATDMIAPWLSAFFDRLNDTQKAQFVALGATPAPAPPAPQMASQTPPPLASPAAAAGGAAPASAAAQACAAAQTSLSAARLWPKAALERAVGHGEGERKALDALQSVVMKAAGQLASSCQPADAVTPPSRLAAIKVRLAAMRATLATFQSALAQVYATLDPVETVDFDAAGSEPARTAAITATAQRALQTAAISPPAETATAEGQPQRRGHGRRHLMRYAHRGVPGPVRVLGRLLGGILP